MCAITLPSSDVSSQGKRAGKRWLTNSKYQSPTCGGRARIKLNHTKRIAKGTASGGPQTRSRETDIMVYRITKCMQAMGLQRGSSIIQLLPIAGHIQKRQLQVSKSSFSTVLALPSSYSAKLMFKQRFHRSFSQEQPSFTLLNLFGHLSSSFTRCISQS